jgi:hypothetical protein
MKTSCAVEIDDRSPVYTLILENNSLAGLLPPCRYATRKR